MPDRKAVPSVAEVAHAPAPLAIFAFVRPLTFEKVLASLARCDDLTCGGRRAGYVFLDGARTDGAHGGDAAKVAAVRELAERFKAERFPSLEIITRARNLGNVPNMRQGISQVLDAHGRIVVVEDDVLVSRHFLQYMDEALDTYRDDLRIWCVNGYRNRLVKVPRRYPHDVYLIPRNGAWGWGTWKDRWDAVDFALSDWPAYRCVPGNLEKVDRAGVDVKRMLDAQHAGQLHAWDVQCTYHIVKNGLWAVEPRLSMTKNIGFGTDGAHCTGENVLVSRAKYYDFSPRLPSPAELQPPPDSLARQFPYMAACPFPVTRIVRKVKRLLWRIGPRNDSPVPM